MVDHHNNRSYDTFGRKGRSIRVVIRRLITIIFWRPLQTEPARLHIWRPWGVALERAPSPTVRAGRKFHLFPHPPVRPFFSPCQWSRRRLYQSNRSSQRETNQLMVATACSTVCTISRNVTCRAHDFFLPPAAAAIRRPTLPRPGSSLRRP